MRAVLLSLLLALASHGVRAAEAPDPRGLWLTASGNLEVRIEPCGAALCGTVARVVANQSMSRPGEAMQGGEPAREGMEILSGFLPSSSAAGADGQRVTTEWRGRIFNRENGKTYDCLMSVAPDGGMLKLHAYVGLPLFGRTQAWQRVAQVQR